MLYFDLPSLNYQVRSDLYKLLCPAYVCSSMLTASSLSAYSALENLFLSWYNK